MASFELIVLGCSGGPKENNLSGYLLSPFQKKSYVSLDAGTLLGGLGIAHKNSHFGAHSVLEVFQNQIKGFLISHPHLDHVAGLVLGSQADIAKPIYGSDFTINMVRDHLFNHYIWPNYGNEGKDPIGQYTYCRLKEGERREVQNTEMTLEMYPLHHAVDCPSSAFLIESRGDYLLYFGDTCSDVLHREKRLDAIWKRIAPLIKQKKLKAILIECSFPRDLKGPAINAHLDSDTLLLEMNHLAKISQEGLEEVPLVVTHRKGGLDPASDFTDRIAEELAQANVLGLKLLFPTQGDKFVF